eukprot:TRINITY_DN5017_c0_g1_i1.p1 TRINITY_DN5017_c0_g1~~TRINITY_DN5017_c0_g1_i1.p1  ORF type:complete len:927 (-),score=212.02 TRINITY_DN5017_c0_g1_i1:78-2732(-)
MAAYWIELINPPTEAVRAVHKHATKKPSAFLDLCLRATSSTPEAAEFPISVQLVDWKPSPGQQERHNETLWECEPAQFTMKVDGTVSVKFRFRRAGVYKLAFLCGHSQLGRWDTSVLAQERGTKKATRAQAGAELSPTQTVPVGTALPVELQQSFQHYMMEHDSGATSTGWSRSGTQTPQEQHDFARQMTAATMPYDEAAFTPLSDRAWGTGTMDLPRTGSNGSRKFIQPQMVHTAAPNAVSSTSSSTDIYAGMPLQTPHSYNTLNADQVFTEDVPREFLASPQRLSAAQLLYSAEATAAAGLDGPFTNSPLPGTPYQTPTEFILSSPSVDSPQADGDALRSKRQRTQRLSTSEELEESSDLIVIAGGQQIGYQFQEISGSLHAATAYDSPVLFQLVEAPACGLLSWDVNGRYKYVGDTIGKFSFKFRSVLQSDWRVRSHTAEERIEVLPRPATPSTFTAVPAPYGTSYSASPADAQVPDTLECLDMRMVDDLLVSAAPPKVTAVDATAEAGAPLAATQSPQQQLGALQLERKQQEARQREALRQCRAYKAEPSQRATVALLQTMREHASDQLVLHKAFSALRNAMKQVEVKDEVGKALGSTGGIVTICQAMQRNTANVDLLSHGFAVLTALALHHHAWREDILRTGVQSLLEQALRIADEPTLASRANELLEALTYQEGETKPLITASEIPPQSLGVNQSVTVQLVGRSPGSQLRFAVTQLPQRGLLHFEANTGLVTYRAFSPGDDWFEFVAVDKDCFRIRSAPVVVELSVEPAGDGSIQAKPQLKPTPTGAAAAVVTQPASAAKPDAQRDVAPAPRVERLQSALKISTPASALPEIASRNPTDSLELPANQMRRKSVRFEPRVTVEHVEKTPRNSSCSCTLL